jgi:hypothetical protein
LDPNEKRDERLWKIAGKRAAFKRQLISYILVNAFFWFIWWWGAGKDYHGVPWPVYPLAGWGLGLAFSYFGAYGNDKNSLTEKEYERLRKQQEQQ